MVEFLTKNKEKLEKIKKFLKFTKKMGGGGNRLIYMD